LSGFGAAGNALISLSGMAFRKV
ncbi:MAG: hypothetical protein RLZZ265_1054, partial [Verrucomicrobiota bacterium]